MAFGNETLSDERMRNRLVHMQISHFMVSPNRIGLTNTIRWVVIAGLVPVEFFVTFRTSSPPLFFHLHPGRGQFHE